MPTNERGCWKTTRPLKKNISIKKHRLIIKMLGRQKLILLAKTSRALSTSAVNHAKLSYQFVVVGGGAGGLSIASSLCRAFGKGKTAVVEPSEFHYYQPLWTLVGGGIKPFSDSAALTSDVMPPLASWYKTAAAEFQPDKNLVLCEDGTELAYEYLIVATGLQLRFDLVKGLPEALHTPGVGSNYSRDTVLDTWKNIQDFVGGNAIFTLPNTPIKCLGAPQKIMYITEEQIRKQGVRHRSNVIFNTALGKIFGVKKYADALTKIINERDIKVNFFRNLVEVNADTKEVVFEVLDAANPNEKKYETYKYDFLHVTPPMSPPPCLRGSPISDANGFVDVNKLTMQHKTYKNIFGIGDCTNSPNGKTAAAVAGQSGVLNTNLLLSMEGKPLTAEYDGYTSCPLVTGHGKLILAEFDFEGNPLETFPFDQGKERTSMYYMKKDILPEVYWNGLVKGLWPGVGTVRRALHLGLKK
ncbi:sulfide:quinone oxidoreductase, mitochondrial-like [Actinia tenebrosa]|uniref:Sulfide:quinone oxidoreductase, mitochondrial n=1 Tax=Actinia tenebrosa TaxID=6105 RepID=A0A6P8IDV2_ACTTE|nr:sulfide:quinone oxidoreductase, mitochondrial-like [Actinia tenebrosa]